MGGRQRDGGGGGELLSGSQRLQVDLPDLIRSVIHPGEDAMQHDNDQVCLCWSGCLTVWRMRV